LLRCEGEIPCLKGYLRYAELKVPRPEAAVFESAGSEIETAAREAIGSDVEFILEAYNYDVDIEEAIENRDW
jgi:hypothetical protein